MINPAGKGKVKKGKGNKWHYEGTFPDVNDGDEVVVVDARTFQKTIESAVGLFLQSRTPMGTSFTKGIFHDELRLNPNTDGERKYFLDRNIYSLDLDKYFWIRYITVNAAMGEELNGFSGEERDGH